MNELLRGYVSFDKKLWPELKKDPGVPKLPDLKLKKNIERQKAVQVLTIYI